MNYTQELCDYINALREYELAHKAWMESDKFTPKGEAARQYMNSSSARLTEARKKWDREHGRKPL